MEHTSGVSQVIFCLIREGYKEEENRRLAWSFANTKHTIPNMFSIAETRLLSVPFPFCASGSSRLGWQKHALNSKGSLINDHYDGFFILDMTRPSSSMLASVIISSTSSLVYISPRLIIASLSSSAEMKPFSSLSKTQSPLNLHLTYINVQCIFCLFILNNFVIQKWTLGCCLR